MIREAESLYDCLVNEKLDISIAKSEFIDIVSHWQYDSLKKLVDYSLENDHDNIELLKGLLMLGIDLNVESSTGNSILFYVLDSKSKKKSKS